MNDSPQTNPARAGRREWTALAVLALPCMLVVMDLTVLFLAVPKLTADLDPSSTQLLWITDIYGFLIAGALITMGTLGDRLGRRKILLMGAVAFGAASLLAALSTSAEMLIAARAIQGIAGATIVPSVMALTYGLFQNETDRTRAMGVIMTAFAGGAAAGPLLGGALLEFFDWNSVFLLNLPVMVALLVLGPRLLPEQRNPDAGRIDLVSTAMSVVAILSVVYGIKEFAREDASTVAIAAVAFGAAIGIAFAHRQNMLEHPLLDMKLFRGRAFSTALASNMLGALAMYGIFLFTSQYMQLGLGLSALEAGLWGLPGIVAMMIASTLLPQIAATARPAYVVAAGMAVTAVGFAMLTQLSADSGVGLLVLAAIVMHVGIAPAATLGTTLILGSAPAEQAGSASSVAEMGNELGGAFGIAVLGSIGTAVYRADVDAAVPADVAPATADAARDTLGGAAEVANQLPAGVFEAANAAWVEAINVIAGLTAGAMVTMAIVTAIVLRHIRSTDGTQAEPETEHAPVIPTAVPVAEAA